MLTSNGNAAYDLSLYDESLRKSKKNEPAGKHVKSTKAMRLKRLEHTSSLKMPNSLPTIVGAIGREPIVVVAAFFLGIVMFVFLSLTYQAKNNELTARIEKTQKQIKVVENEYGDLKIRYDMLVSDAAIEEYAIKNLGMQKAKQYQSDYITVGSGQTFDTDDSEKTGFFDFLTSYFE